MQKKLLLYITSLFLTFMLFSCQEETFTVTFNSQGGSAIDSEIINSGHIIEEPDDPTLEGMVFEYWYVDDMNDPYDFSLEVTGNLTLIAYWSEENTEEVEHVMENLTAQEVVSRMKIGWNLGDSLDVCNADRNGDGTVDENAAVVDETLWGNVMTTKALFDNLKKDGINAVRIPITWRDHLGEAPEYTVDADWMNRVEEVVRYAYDNDMYVIINVHHDGGGDPDFGAWIRSASSFAQKDEVLAKFAALWQQIADRFKDYSDKLIFEAMNEVGFDDMTDTYAFQLLKEFNQTFIDVVRASGGNNPVRHILVAGYWTDIAKTSSDLYELPTDTIEDHMILSIHYYTPWQFATTNKQTYWGTPEEVTQMEDLVQMIYDHFTAVGVPVLMGEYGFGPNDPASTVYFSELFVKLCYDKGISTFLWDNGEQYDRTNMYWYNPDLIEALQRAVSGEDYTVVKG